MLSIEEVEYEIQKVSWYTEPFDYEYRQSIKDNTFFVYPRWHETWIKSKDELKRNSCYIPFIHKCGKANNYEILKIRLQPIYLKSVLK